MNERKVCVVTGSSSGIGAATVRLYAQRGWDVVINYSRDVAPAEAIATECQALGVDTLVVKGDVACDRECRQLAAHVLERFGRADVLVNNAGTTKFVELKDLDGLDAQDFQRIYAVNVIGAFQMSRAFVSLLHLHPGSAIVNISSVAPLLGAGSSLAYIASKGALNAMTMALARALGPAIRVNAIAPGLVQTPWMQNGLGAERYEQTVTGYKSRAALDAVIEPEDVAEAAWWFGVGALKTTGEILLVDAGVKLARG
jgi:3-oxoacyl-[acyl-carrier protein] reductase